MSRPLMTLGALVLAALAPRAATASALTQNVSLPITPTNFGSTPGSITGPELLAIQPFDTRGGTRTLDQVQLTVNASIRSDFGLNFVTPGTITESVATGNPASPGPSVTLYQPDGKTPILDVQAPNDPGQLSRSATYGSQPGQALPQAFSSGLPSSSPFYIPPIVNDQTKTATLTSPADLARFEGTGTINLPVSADAMSRFTTSSGNGDGHVATSGTANVTVTYVYHQASPQVLPEPGALALWGLAGLAALAARRVARR